jgi:hypothetical protein
MVFESIPKDTGMIPMYFPGDDQALAGIREIAEKGNPKNADHTLKNVDSFRLWEDISSKLLKRNAITRSSTILSSIQSNPMSSFVVWFLIFDHLWGQIRCYPSFDTQPVQLSIYCDAVQR